MVLIHRVSSRAYLAVCLAYLHRRQPMLQLAHHNIQQKDQPTWLDTLRIVRFRNLRTISDLKAMARAMMMMTVKITEINSNKLHPLLLLFYSKFQTYSKEMHSHYSTDLIVSTHFVVFCLLF